MHLVITQYLLAKEQKTKTNKETKQEHIGGTLKQSSEDVPCPTSRFPGPSVFSAGDVRRCVSLCRGELSR